MKAPEFLRLAERLLRHPTAPYHEQDVRAAAEEICAEHGLAPVRDAFGNVIVRLRTAPRLRPLLLAAHLDHPGFEIVRPIAGGRWLARFCGGVAHSYFRSGTPLRLMPGGVPAQLGRRRPAPKERLFELEPARAPAVPPLFAVWELTDFALRRGRIYARACDDLIGVAAILATLVDLKRSRAQVNVLGVFSRAEEVGFRGALALAAEARHAPLLRRDSLMISLETSRELPGVRMGQGAILRVGDRASVFDPEATRFLAEVAGDLKQRDKSFVFQRALMSGGTCEATAYQEFGFQSAAVCIALGNYHNCGQRDRIRPEYVSVDDACGMVTLLAGACRRMSEYRALVSRLPRRLNHLLREARSKLLRTA